MNYRSLIQECMSRGWEPSRITGGHLIMTKEHKRSVPVPIHGRSIPDSIIMKQLEQPPPSKSPKIDSNIIVKPQKEQPSKQRKPLKPKKVHHYHQCVDKIKAKESDGLDMLLSNDDAALLKEELQLTKEQLTHYAAEYYTEENYRETIMLLNLLVTKFRHLIQVDEMTEIIYRFGLCYYRLSEQLPIDSKHLWVVKRSYRCFAKITSCIGPISEQAKEYIDKLILCMWDQIREFTTNATSYREKDDKTLEYMLKCFTFCGKDRLLQGAQTLFGVAMLCCTELYGRTKNSMYLEKAVKFVDYALEQGSELQESFVLCVQRLVAIMIVHIKNRVDNKITNETVLDLMELGKNVPRLEFSVSCVNFKMHQVIRPKEKDQTTPLTAEYLALLEEVSQIPPDLNNIKYLICRSRVYWNAITNLAQTEIATPEGIEYHLKAKELWDLCLKDMKIVRAAAPEEVPSFIEVKTMTVGMLECTQGIFEYCADLMQGCQVYLLLLKHTRSEARAWEPAFGSLRQKYLKELNIIANNEEKIRELEKKKVFTKEEIEFCKQFATFVSEVDKYHARLKNKLGLKI